jgi:hypothetical protein
MKSVPLLQPRNHLEKRKPVKPRHLRSSSPGCSQLEMLYRANLHLLDRQPLALWEAVPVGMQLVLPFLLL